MQGIVRRIFGKLDDVKIEKPVFIVGCGRSGTAFLFNLLKLSPEMIATHGHPDGEDHVGWITHGGAVIAGLATPHGDSGHVGHNICPYMDESHATDALRTSMHRYYARDVLKGQPSRRVLNKCPHLSNKLRYVRALFPDARFLHIVRDPVAMAASWVNVMRSFSGMLLYWPEVDYPCWWVFPTRDAATHKHIVAQDPHYYPGGGLERVADYWAAVNAHIPKQLADTPDQLMSVRHEDLLARTDETMARIRDFCDLREKPVGRLEVERERHTLYRSLLTEEQVKAIRLRTRETAARFGYAET